MKNKKIIVITAASIFIGTSIISANASSLKARSGAGPCYEDRGFSQRTAFMEAIEAGDYESWKSLMEENERSSKILQAIQNEEDFAKFAEAHKLLQDGKKEEAEAIFEELGIVFKDMGGDRKRAGEKGGNFESSEEVMQAIESGDYELWKELMGERGGKILEIVNEDNFSQFAEAKILQSNGDYESAKEILDDLGFPFKDRGVRRFQGRY